MIWKNIVSHTYHLPVSIDLIINIACRNKNLHRIQNGSCVKTFHDWRGHYEKLQASINYTLFSSGQVHRYHYNWNVKIIVYDVAEGGSILAYDTYHRYLIYNDPEGHFSLPRIPLSKIPEMIENFSISNPTAKMLVQSQCTDKVKVRTLASFSVLGISSGNKCTCSPYFWAG